MRCGLGGRITEGFGGWWETLTGDQQDDVAHGVGLLTELGPALGFPHSSKVNGSRHGHMRELRTQSAGKPLRTLYAFDPLRTAILLLVATKQATIDGTRKPFRSRTGSMTSI